MGRRKPCVLPVPSPCWLPACRAPIPAASNPAALPPAAGAKENRVPAGGGGGPLAGALACGVAVAGGALLHLLQKRSGELQKQLSQTRSELESKSSQLSEALAELEHTRRAAGPGGGWGGACLPACLRSADVHATQLQRAACLGAGASWRPPAATWRARWRSSRPRGAGWRSRRARRGACRKNFAPWAAKPAWTAADRSC